MPDRLSVVFFFAQQKLLFRYPKENPFEADCGTNSASNAISAAALGTTISSGTVGPSPATGAGASASPVNNGDHGAMPTGDGAQTQGTDMNTTGTSSQQDPATGETASGEQPTDEKRTGDTREPGSTGASKKVGVNLRVAIHKKKRHASSVANAHGDGRGSGSVGPLKRAVDENAVADSTGFTSQASATGDSQEQRGNDASPRVAPVHPQNPIHPPSSSSLVSGVGAGPSPASTTCVGVPLAALTHLLRSAFRFCTTMQIGSVTFMFYRLFSPCSSGPANAWAEGAIGERLRKNGAGRENSDSPMLVVALNQQDDECGSVARFVQCFVNVLVREELRVRYVSEQVSVLMDAWDDRATGGGGGGGAASGTAGAGHVNAGDLGTTALTRQRIRASRSNTLVKHAPSTSTTHGNAAQAGSSDFSQSLTSVGAAGHSGMSRVGNRPSALLGVHSDDEQHVPSSTELTLCGELVKLAESINGNYHENIVINDLIQLPHSHLSGHLPFYRGGTGTHVGGCTGGSVPPAALASSVIRQEPTRIITVEDDDFPHELEKQYVEMVGKKAATQLPLHVIHARLHALPHPWRLGSLYRSLEMYLLSQMCQKRGSAQPQQPQQPVQNGSSLMPNRSVGAPGVSSTWDAYLRQHTVEGSTGPSVLGQQQSAAAHGTPSPSSTSSFSQFNGPSTFPQPSQATGSAVGTPLHTGAPFPTLSDAQEFIILEAVEFLRLFVAISLDEEGTIAFTHGDLTEMTAGNMLTCTATATLARMSQAWNTGGAPEADSSDLPVGGGQPYSPQSYAAQNASFGSNSVSNTYTVSPSTIGSSSMPLMPSYATRNLHGDQGIPQPQQRCPVYCAWGNLCSICEEASRLPDRRCGTSTCVLVFPAQETTPMQQDAQRTNTSLGSPWDPHAAISSEDRERNNMPNRAPGDINWGSSAQPLSTFSASSFANFTASESASSQPWFTRPEVYISSLPVHGQSSLHMYVRMLDTYVAESSAGLTSTLQTGWNGAHQQAPSTPSALRNTMQTQQQHQQQQQHQSHHGLPLPMNSPRRRTNGASQSNAQRRGQSQYLSMDDDGVILLMSEHITDDAVLWIKEFYDHIVDRLHKCYIVRQALAGNPSFLHIIQTLCTGQKGDAHTPPSQGSGGTEASLPSAGLATMCTVSPVTVSTNGSAASGGALGAATTGAHKAGFSRNEHHSRSAALAETGMESDRNLPSSPLTIGKGVNATFRDAESGAPKRSAVTPTSALNGGGRQQSSLLSNELPGLRRSLNSISSFASSSAISPTSTHNRIYPPFKPNESLQELSLPAAATCGRKSKSRKAADRTGVSSPQETASQGSGLAEEESGTLSSPIEKATGSGDGDTLPLSSSPISGSLTSGGTKRRVLFPSSAHNRYNPLLSRKKKPVASHTSPSHDDEQPLLTSNHGSTKSRSSSKTCTPPSSIPLNSSGSKLDDGQSRHAKPSTWMNKQDRGDTDGSGMDPEATPLSGAVIPGRCGRNAAGGGSCDVASTTTTATRETNVMSGPGMYSNSVSPMSLGHSTTWQLRSDDEQHSRYKHDTTNASSLEEHLHNKTRDVRPGSPISTTSTHSHRAETATPSSPQANTSRTSDQQQQQQQQQQQTEASGTGGGADSDSSFPRQRTTTGVSAAGNNTQNTAIALAQLEDSLTVPYEVLVQFVLHHLVALLWGKDGISMDVLLRLVERNLRRLRPFLLYFPYVMQLAARCGGGRVGDSNSSASSHTASQRYSKLTRTEQQLMQTLDVYDRLHLTDVLRLHVGKRLETVPVRALVHSTVNAFSDVLLVGRAERKTLSGAAL